MHVPAPAPGLVIRYSYLWHSESRSGRESGAKDRPCIVLGAFPRDDGGIRVIVVPVTRTRPEDATFSAVELSGKTKQRLGLARDPMWVVCAEANEFEWTGPDLRPVPNVEPPTCEYGHIGQALFDAIREKFLFIADGKQLKLAKRTE